MSRVHSSALLLVLLAALPACSRDSTTSASELSEVIERSAEAASSPWCGEGFRALGDTACVALPERFADPPSLVVYAHGMIAPDALPAGEQATLLAAARTHGFAVLFPRGSAGLCTWEPGVTRNLCWPTKQEAVDAAGPSILAGWEQAQAQAEEVAGKRFERRYLFGFSNGGYFVSFLVVEGRFGVDGAGVVGAGRTAIDETLSGPAHPPFYLATGDQEADVTRSDAANLAQVLTLRGWPVTHVVHPGRGHELQQDDLAAAWARWGR